MTTAELGLITTAIVGVAAAASPALVSSANRRHERTMARSTACTSNAERLTRISQSFLSKRDWGFGQAQGIGIAVHSVQSVVLAIIVLTYLV
jgi:hypothetical protein